MSFEPVAIEPSPLPNLDTKLRILPFSDLHLPQASTALILQNRTYLDRMDYVVLLGDMTRCYGTDEEYAVLRGFISEMGRPYTAVMGNHEWFFEILDETSGLYGTVWSETGRETKAAQQRKFLEFFRLPKPWRSFSNALGHFVFLSIDEVSSHRPEVLSRKQADWFLDEIEAAGEKPLFVFCHVPLMLDLRLDMIYYDETRSGCLEANGELGARLKRRAAPTFWMSGHIHLRPDQYLFSPYRTGGNVWQIHCPDSWGYGRWKREQRIPQRYEGVFSRHLEIDAEGVTFVSHDHRRRQDSLPERVDY